MRWNGTGGFYALQNQADVTVNLGGAGATLVWNDGLFVPTGHALILGTDGTGGAARQLDFQNGVDLSGGLRQVRADAGSIADHAVMSGVLTGTGGLQVVGTGMLELTNAGNNYSGATVVGDNTTFNVGNLLLGAAGALSANSNLQINGASVGSLVQHGGYVLLDGSSGPFTRAVGTGAGQVQWTGSGGFGAVGAPQTVNLGGAGATFTWGSGGFVQTGHALRFGGNWANSTINWENGIDLGALNRVINVNEGQGAGYQNTGELEVNLNGVIQGTGGLILNGQGDLALNAPNTYGGTTWIGGTSVTGDGDNTWVWVNTLANTGVASSLGTGSTVVLGSHVGGLIYTGGATSTNRTIELNRTTGAIHHLFNYGTGALTWTGNITTTGSGMNDLRLGGTYATTTVNGVAVAPNVVSGIISNGSGVTRIRGWNSGSCTTGGVWRLTGANTFTGEVSPDGCVIEATTIANAGTASAVGAGNLIADFRSLDGTLRYVGSGDTSNRLFWSWGNSHLESSGTGALNLTNTGIVVSQNGGFTHWLGGTNTGDNKLAATLVNGPTPVEFTTSWFRLGKEGPGLWALTTDNNAQATAFSGMTRIFGGALRLDSAGAITGGLGVTSSHGATGSSQRSSLIRFEGAADGTGGVLGLTAASGGFFRSVTTAADAFVNNNGTTLGVDPDGVGPLPAYGVEALNDDNYVQGVRWFGSGGFAAWDGTQTVNLFGDGREVTWNGGGFVPTNHNLVFGYQTATGTVDFRNGINLGNGTRTIEVRDGSADVDATMSGVLRSTNVLGALTKTGTGTLVLEGNNTYTGATNLQAGGLYVYGYESAATGLLSAASGTTLGGEGTIGGTVLMATGTTLNPGDIGSTPGTLAINGALTLNSGTTLNYDFGEANTVGGALNDLITVGGNLTLDGTLNVATSGGGSFGPGIYRIMNYGGTLTNGGLTIGTMPSPDYHLQTSVANQINLVNLAGLDLSFWDGPALPRNNGIVNGGTGTWILNNNENWATIDGLINAPYQNGSFTVFQGGSGVATVDNSQGQITASGMQFAANGYTIAGGPLTLDGPQSTVRVGDGTLAGAGYVATITSVLQGTSQLVKTDRGTLVLTGTNTYSGGTAINGGTLQVASNDNLGAVGGGLSFDGGTLENTGAFSTSRAVTLNADGGTSETTADLTLTGLVSGTGALTKDGAGTLALTATNNYTGDTTIANGTLQLGAGGGTGSILGDVVNNGTLSFNRSNNYTFAGDISGTGGVNQIGTGTTTLTGSNTYTGGTTISAGSLVVGNGGTQGSIIGDVSNDAALSFLRSNNVTFGGTISGTGTLTQQGSGNLILSADNSYLGATTVQAGGLYINGDQSAATGDTTVVAGTLGGGGTIGGDVTLAAGTSLSPGALGTAPGTLTINGFLEVGDNANLNYSFGQANVVGGALNDLTIVHGDLTFNGGSLAPALINVVSASTSFDAGIYRVVTYDGTLTGADGLAVGSQPLGTDFFVQTSVANQINLVNLAGLNLSFWDGPALPRNNGVLEGGTGTWILNNNEYWATIDGLINAPYQNGSFTVFQGAAGTVTVDNSQGQLTAAGMQFATDGYTLAGGTLTLAGPQSTIRVGDGTLAGAGYVATITSVLQGGAQLVKADLGTLVLTATNTYSGGTAINGGTLQVASNANLGALAGGLSFDGGTLENTASFTSNRAVTLDAAGGTFEATADLTLTGLVSGTGALTKDGAGTLVLTATNNYTGNTTIAAGTLQLGAGARRDRSWAMSSTTARSASTAPTATLSAGTSRGPAKSTRSALARPSSPVRTITVGRPTLSRAHCSSTATSPAPPA